jgi:hypothetical protein
MPVAKAHKCLIFNCPALKGGAIVLRDIQGFSHIIKTFVVFLD